jgi:subfamily B ATP-binding cassette protein MsbA
MRQLSRLLQYALPYWLHVLGAVLLLGGVGLLDAFRVLLIGPMLDRVLNPGSMSENIALLTVPGTDRTIYLQQFMPDYFQNAWTLVAMALVGSTLLKGLLDYLGTYLVNYAGFGMITDLRDRLYNRILRQSASFYHRHSTGTLLSTIVNDVERVQYAMSTVFAEFLTQLFIFLFTVAIVIALGGKFALVLLVFLPIIIFSAMRVGSRVRTTTRRGQDRLAEIQNILHETITGNRVVKAFGMERWEIGRRIRRHRHRIAAAAWPRRHQGRLLQRGLVPGVHRRSVQTLRSGAQVRGLQQQLPAGPRRLPGDLQFHGRGRRSEGEARGAQAAGLLRVRPL